MNCAFCSKEFKPRSSQQVYCNARCRQDRHNRDNAQYIRKSTLRRWIEETQNICCNNWSPTIDAKELLDFLKNC